MASPGTKVEPSPTLNVPDCCVRGGLLTINSLTPLDRLRLVRKHETRQATGFALVIYWAHFLKNLHCIWAQKPSKSG